MLCYRTYRVNNRGQSENAHGNKRVHSTIQNLKNILGSKKFDGLGSLSIMTFLVRLKFEANKNNASGGMTKLVLLRFLEGNALIAFQIALHLDGVDADSAGRRT